LLSFEGRGFLVSQADIDSFAFERFGLSDDDFWISGSGFCREINLRLAGGKGGFGRAMRQEGERRSRKLPPHKDACRTLSGKRIGSLKAKRRIAVLRSQIEDFENQRREVLALRHRSNVEKELELIEQRQHDLGQSVQEAVAAGIVKSAETPTDQKPTGTVDDEFALLYDSP
jgi:hypothetical protein